MNQIELDHLKRVTDICANRGEIIENQGERLVKFVATNAELTATNDRRALMIYAKDRQITELTRMLFALGKQDGQTIRTQAAEIAHLTEKVRYAYIQIEALEAK